MRRAIKRATIPEQDYQDRARALGCVVCRHMGWQQLSETQIHHRNIGDMHGQKQLGQHAVVAMCVWHHQGVPADGMQAEAMREMCGPSYQLHARDFRVWTDDVLPNHPGRGTEKWQAVQDELLGVE